MLIEHFLNRCNEEHGKCVEFSPDAIEAMVRHGWPGNVRELENCVERGVIMTRETKIDASELKKHMNLLLHSDRAAVEQVSAPFDDSLPGNVRTIECEQISDALRQCGGIQARAAKLLGLTSRQIGYKIRKYKIESSRAKL